MEPGELHSHLEVLLVTESKYLAHFDNGFICKLCEIKSGVYHGLHLSKCACARKCLSLFFEASCARQEKPQPVCFLRARANLNPSLSDTNDWLVLCVDLASHN